MERLRYDYEVLLELAVKEKENEMRNTIIENEELEDLAAQVLQDYTPFKGITWSLFITCRTGTLAYVRESFIAAWDLFISGRTTILRYKFYILIGVALF